MATKLQWLPGLLLLLLLFPIFIISLETPKEAASGARNPVVLLPGNTCSQIEARLTDAYEPPSPRCAKGAGNKTRWSRLWKNTTAPEPDAPCFADQLRLVYDHAADDYRNPSGVLTRALSFGSTRGFLSDTPADKELCMGRLVEALERAGYVDGETLFGAPYDFRHAAAPPGTPNREFSSFRRRLRALVEHASMKNGDKPVVLVSHSQGGYFALEFLNRTPLPWRTRLVRRLVLASTGAGGFVLSMQSLASSNNANGSGSTPYSPANVLSLRRVSASFESVFTALPSPRVFGPDTPLVVITPGNKSYAARDMREFLTAVAGFTPDAARRYETRALPVALSFRAPLVPVTCVNGVGVPTAEKLVYRADGAGPEVVYGDGDGVVNLASILALDDVFGGDPRQEDYKSVKIANMSHLGVVSDDLAIQILVGEILEQPQEVDTPRVE